MPDRRISLRELLWLLCAMGIPLLVLPLAYSKFELPKVMALQGIVLVLAIATLVGGKPPDTVKPNPHRILLWSAALYGASMILSTLFASNQQLSLWGNYERQQGLWAQLSTLLLFLCTTFGIRSRTQHKLLWETLVLGSIPVVFLGLLQIIKPLPAPIVTDSVSAVTSTLGRSNFFASYLVLMIPLTAYSLFDRMRKQDALTSQTRWLTPVYGFLLVGQVICLVATRSRAAWVGLAAAHVFMVIWLSRHGRVTQRTIRWIVIAGLIILISLLGVSQFLSARDSTPDLAQSLDPTRDSVAARLTIWQTVIDLIQKRPLLGYGFDTMRSIFIRHYPPQLVFYQGRSNAVDRAHNIFLDAVYHTGFLGLCAAAVVWFTVMKSVSTRMAAQSKSRSQLPGLQAAILGAALLGHLLEQQFSFEVTATSTVAWLIAALIMTLENNSAADDPQPDSENARHLDLWLDILLYGMTAGIIWLAVVQPLRADIAYAMSQNTALPAAARLDSAQHAVKDWPLQTEYWLSLAEIAAETENMAVADQAMASALKLEPENPHIFALWGDLYAGINPQSPASLEQAVNAYEAAVLLAPTVAGYHTALGVTQARQEDYRTSRVVLERAVALDPTEPSVYLYLAAVYQALGETELASNAEKMAEKWSTNP